MAKVGVVGATSWGTTLAIILARWGAKAFLWARSEEEAGTLNSARENRRLLAGFTFPPGLTVTPSREEAFSNADLIIFAVPSDRLRENVRSVRRALKDSSIIMSASKGLELGTSKRMSQVLQDELPPSISRNLCVLSGPNLAQEIVQGKPSSSVVASKDRRVAEEAQRLMMSPLFRIYTNDDVVGVELGGALKNIVAIGAGICDGLAYGDNAKAAFITRGLVEITRLGVAAGADPLTLAGLAGLGDLIATCSSRLSRNHYLGEQLSKRRSLSAVRLSMNHVAEGVNTTPAALEMAKELGVEMPIAQATSRVLFEGMDPKQAVAELMERAPRPEWSGLKGPLA